MTDGAKPIDNLRYYTRLAQRTNNLLSAASSNGIIYDIDTRLRPGGRADQTGIDPSVVVGIGAGESLGDLADGHVLPLPRSVRRCRPSA